MDYLIDGLGRTWAWLESDTECKKVIFDTSTDLIRATRHCKEKRSVVQAGGNMGVWPWLLSKEFERVYTFEPDPACYELLVKNTAGFPQIKAAHAGLWSSPGKCNIVVEENHNRGAQFIDANRGETERVTIDSLELRDCDLIYLDIEGAEMHALKGAVATIRRCKPVIAVEDKNLSRRYGTLRCDIENWLEKDFGYNVVDRPHRDVIMTCA